MKSIDATAISVLKATVISKQYELITKLVAYFKLYGDISEVTTPADDFMYAEFKADVLSIFKTHKKFEAGVLELFKKYEEDNG